MSGKYWEEEQPLTIDTGKNVFRYFAKAGKLQVSMPYWTDKDGTQKPGKTITISIDAIKETAKARELFAQIGATE